jgi:hypothetical protein
MQRSKLFWRLISIRWRRRQKWSDHRRFIPGRGRVGLEQVGGARGQSVSRKCAARQSSSKAGHDGDPRLTTLCLRRGCGILRGRLHSGALRPRGSAAPYRVVAVTGVRHISARGARRWAQPEADIVISWVTQLIRTPPRASAQSWTKYVGRVAKIEARRLVAGGPIQPNCFESELGR